MLNHIKVQMADTVCVVPLWAGVLDINAVLLVLPARESFVLKIEMKANKSHRKIRTPRRASLPRYFRAVTPSQICIAYTKLVRGGSTASSKVIYLPHYEEDEK